MTERTIQSILVTTGLTEAELADLLEGGTISPLRESLLRSTLAQHPDIARFFAGVRADRTAMRVLDQTVHAPAGLLEAVEIRLDQEALRTLTEPTTPAPIPVAAATTRIERRNPIAVFIESTWARRLATAAGLALAIGLGVWGTYIGIQNWPRGGSSPSRNDRELVRNDAVPSPVESPNDIGASGTVIASAEPTTPAFTVLAATSPADGPGIAADGTVLGETELLHLAGEGRLAIVVSGDARGLPSRIGRLAAGSREFSIASIAEEAVTTSMSPLAAAIARENALPRADWAAALRNPWSGRSAGAISSASRQIINVASSTDPSSLRSVLTTCGLFGDGGNVPGRTVRILVLDHSIEQVPAIDPTSVLWWSASPAKWSRTTTVPVIIEE